MDRLSGRLRREHETFRCMARIYCAEHHGLVAGELCPACEDLMRYAERRLEKCPYGPNKPPCANCPIHCYKPEPREKVREIMRYAGPHMTWRHPWRALVHVFDKLRKAVHPRELRARRNRLPGEW